MMNNEVIKAMNRKNEKHPIRDWWKKNKYKILRVVLFPVWAPVALCDKIKSKMRKRQVWSEERANEILSYYIPRYADWDDEEKTFFFFDNGMGWNLCHAKKRLKRKDRRWWGCFAGFGGYKVRRYLIDSFELEGFEKEVGCCDDGWTEVSFRMI